MAGAGSEGVGTVVGSWGFVRAGDAERGVERERANRSLCKFAPVPVAQISYISHRANVAMGRPLRAQNLNSTYHKKNV